MGYIIDKHLHTSNTHKYTQIPAYPHTLAQTHTHTLVHHLYHIRPCVRTHTTTTTSPHPGIRLHRNQCAKQEITSNKRTASSAAAGGGGGGGGERGGERGAGTGIRGRRKVIVVLTTMRSGSSYISKVGVTCNTCIT